MLERLTIRDFAVARSVVIEPGEGLNVFTGETGAGKSIVVDALVFVFGGRRGREVIAHGAERALVEAIVRAGGRRVTLERSIAISGRSSARIDGEPATVEALRELAGEAVEIHGQSEHLAILRPNVQLSVLDGYARLDAARAEVTELVRALRETRRKIETLASDSRERERLIDQLRFEADEIEAAELTAGEEAVLREEMSRLSNAGRLIAGAESALEALEAAPLGLAARAVAELADRDVSAGELRDEALAIEAAAADLARGLRRYRDALEEDPARLAAVQERLDLVARLCRKYGERTEDVLAYGAAASERLATLSDAGSSIEALRAVENGCLEALAVKATALSRARRARAGELVQAIAAELEHLGMGGAALSVGFACEDDEAGPQVALPDYEIVITESPLAGEGEVLPRAFTEAGIDRVEFMASFNAGEPPRPLSAVASGGETSRFLLALTTVLGAASPPRTVVLDEVDEGVGGRAGGLVGAALRRLAARQQVLCVTHLPQVAAFAERHFVVTKRSEGGRTWSEVVPVEGPARTEELASMLGGASTANLAAAAELLTAR